MARIPPRSFRRFVALLVAALWCQVVLGQNFDEVQITSIKLTDNIYMLTGLGANIGVSFGNDGVLLIDDEFPQLVGKIKMAVAQLSKQPIRIVFNTNWHFDHADGNALLAEGGAVIVAHMNSRAHMLTEQRMPEFDSILTIQPYPAAALPVITFADSLTVHFNADIIHVVHLPNAHSDGDLLLRFEKANIVHTGDLFWPNAIPFINFSGGGSIEGMIRSTDRILDMCDANTRVIPGHGSVSNRDDVRAFRDLLVTVRDRLDQTIQAGKTVDEAVLAVPLAEIYKGRRSYFPINELTRYGYLDLQRGREIAK